MNADLAYAAGFIDGEGCFRIESNGAVAIRVVNTHRPTLEFLQGLLGGSVAARKQRINKPQYLWAVYGDNALSATELLLPYLREKRPQAELLVTYRKDCRPIRLPNRRGMFRNPERELYVRELSELKQLHS
jgi:hypothetical protein